MLTDGWRILPVDRRVDELTEFAVLLENAPPEVKAQLEPIPTPSVFDSIKNYIAGPGGDSDRLEAKDSEKTKENEESDLPHGDREFWMSNQNSPNCSECHIQFHALRRRHHCRLCGCVFCHNCCGEMINGKVFYFQGPIRVCTNCKKLDPDKPLFGVADEDYCITTALPKNLDEEDDETSATDTILRNALNTAEYHSPTIHNRHHPTLNKIFGDVNSDKDDSPRDPSDSSRRSRILKKKKSSKLKQGSGLHSRKRSANPDFRKEKSKRSTVDNRKRRQPKASDKEEDVAAKDDLSAEQWVNVASNAEEDFTMTDETEQETNKHLNDLREVYRHHIRHVINNLVKKHGVDEEWEEIVVMNSVKVNSFIRFLPDDQHDIRHYVKVKRVAGGERGDTRLIRGVVFRHNVAHRKMRTTIENPKVLLLSCSIDAHKTHNNLASFDLLLKQEQEYTQLLVKRISYVAPDIVVVCGSVSRLAQRLLLQEDITLLVGVQQSHIARLGRSLGVPVINSIDILTHLDNDQIIGTCGVFRTEYFKDDLVGNKGRDTPLLFFEDCPSRLHATILLRGEDRETLGKIKTLVRLGIHAAYHAELEVSYLNDRRVQMPADWKENYEQIQEANEKGDGFLSTSPFIKRHVHSRQRRKPHRPFRIDKESAYVNPYFYHAVGPNVNTLRSGWNPFYPNPDNHHLNQSLVILHCRMTNKSQCFPPRMKLIDFYSKLDATLGSYLIERFRLQSCPVPDCKVPALFHRLSYSMFDGRITVLLSNTPDKQWHKMNDPNNERIVMWSVCTKCNRPISKVVPISDKTYKMSFGKFLEQCFFNHVPIGRTSGCTHTMDNHVQNFARGPLVISFEYQHIPPYFIISHPELQFKKARADVFKFHFEHLKITIEIATALFNAWFMKTTEIEHQLASEEELQDLHKLVENIKMEHQHVLKELTKTKETLQVAQDSFENDKKDFEWDEDVYQNVARMKHHMYEITQQWHASLLTILGITEDTDTHDRDYVSKFAEFLRLQPKSKPSAVDKMKMPEITSFGDGTVDTNTPQDVMTSHQSQPEEVSLTLPPYQGVTIESLFNWDPSSDKEVELKEQLMKEARFLDPRNSHGCLNLPKCFKGKIIPVFGNEPASLIAYSLCSVEFLAQVNNIPTSQVRSCRANNTPTLQELEAKITSKINDRKSDPSWVVNDILAHIPKIQGMEKIDMLTNTDAYVDQVQKQGASEPQWRDKIKLQFEDCGYYTNHDAKSPDSTKKHNKKQATILDCYVYYPKQFEALRKICCDGDENFIKSMVRSFTWNATGGKSRSTFAKSGDNRYALKFVKEKEFSMFVNNGTKYFEHMARWHYKHYPSILATILGVFQISVNRHSKYVLVMPNLFYGRNVTIKFDLKGNHQNREVKSENQTPGRTLLDTNFLNYTEGYPLPLEDLSKNQLHKSIHNDSLFLCKLGVVDYSLLCGICDDTNEIVVGIIDYLREHTILERVETTVKLVVRRAEPTVVKPEKYRNRFRQAMDKYFMSAPDRLSRRPTRTMDKSTRKHYPLEHDIFNYHINF